jgi:hypothetical protein
MTKDARLYIHIPSWRPLISCVPSHFRNVFANHGRTRVPVPPVRREQLCLVAVTPSTLRHRRCAQSSSPKPCFFLQDGMAHTLRKCRHHLCCRMKKDALGPQSPPSRALYRHLFVAALFDGPPVIGYQQPPAASQENAVAAPQFHPRAPDSVQVVGEWHRVFLQDHDVGTTLKTL